MLYYNNVLHYEVAEDVMKTDELSEVAELADRAIHLIRSKTIVFIFISPLPRVHFCLKKVWQNPKRAPPGVGATHCGVTAALGDVCVAPAGCEPGAQHHAIYMWLPSCVPTVE